MDRRRLKGIDEGAFKSLLSTLAKTDFRGLGVYCSNRGACPIRNGQNHRGVSLLLLPCTTQCHQFGNAGRDQSSPGSLSYPPRHLHSNWGPCRHIPPPSALPRPLPPFHSALWFPQRPMFIDHRVKTYQGRQGTLAPLQQIQSSYTDAPYNLPARQDGGAPQYTGYSGNDGRIDVLICGYGTQGGGSPTTWCSRG